MVSVGDHVKVNRGIDEHPKFGTRGLADRYGHVVELKPMAMAVVEFNDFKTEVPIEYLKVVTGTV